MRLNDDTQQVEALTEKLKAAEARAEAAERDAARMRRVCVEVSITLAQVSPSVGITVKESDRLDHCVRMLRDNARKKENS